MTIRTHAILTAASALFFTAFSAEAGGKYSGSSGVNATREVPRIALMRDASIDDFQIAKIPGNGGTTAAPFVGHFWDCSNVEDPDFDFCDFKLVFCPKPGEKGCWVID